jgi:hypothetical protein
MNPIDPCPCCVGSDISLKGAETHFEFNAPKYLNVVILQWPIDSIIRHCFQKALEIFDKRGDRLPSTILEGVVSRFSNKRLYEADGSYYKIEERTKEFLDDPRLSKEQRSAIIKILLSDMQTSFRGGEASVELESPDLLAQLRKQGVDDDMLRELQALFREPFPYPSVGSIDGLFSGLSREVMRAMLKLQLFFRTADAWMISVEMSRSISRLGFCDTPSEVVDLPFEKEEKGSNQRFTCFPSEKILQALLRQIVTQKELITIASSLDGATLTVDNCQDDDERRKAISDRIGAVIHPVPLDAHLRALLAGILSASSSSSFDSLSKRITFKEKSVLLSNIEEGFPCAVRFAREKLDKLPALLAKQKISYEETEKNPKLLHHIEVYAKEALKDLSLDPMMVKMITELLIKLAI